MHCSVARNGVKKAFHVLLNWETDSKGRCMEACSRENGKVTICVEAWGMPHCGLWAAGSGI